MLHVEGTRIVDENGASVLLRGVGLGGWMNMENFITGYPANEETWRGALLEALGRHRYDLFFDRFLEYFFGEDDAAYLGSLGLNCVRIAVNYRHFESDMAPFEIREEGFAHLDRVIDICARHQIYTVIDFHAVQGYQNGDWHSDNPTHRAFLWDQKGFQDRAAHLWEVIAARYRGNRWVAGYNLINEPNDVSGGAKLIAVTRRLYDAVRAVDPDHIVFIDGNKYASDFSPFTEAWPNAVYDAHDYAMCGFLEGGPWLGYTGDVLCDHAWLERHFLKKSAFMREHNAPTWIGEFGPVYTFDPTRDENMYQLTRDQIALFERYGTGWSIWTYKDIGLQGLVYLDPHSPYMELLAGVPEKKARLGVDSWGGTDADVAPVLGQMEGLFAREFPDGTPLPWNPGWQMRRLVRSMLFAEAMVPEVAARFAHLDDEGIDRVMRSFAFDQCFKREGLAAALTGRLPATTPA